MRIKIKFSKNTTEIPVNNQSIMNSYIHKCLGVNNEYHDGVSDYNISQLCGGSFNKSTNMLNYNNGGFIIISSGKLEFINTIISGVMKNKTFGYGMEFIGVDFINDEFYDGWNHFKTLSPILLKEKNNDGTYKFINVNDNEFSDKLKGQIIRKLNKINPKLNLRDFDIKIQKTGIHKVKKILVKNVINTCSHCHISIKSNKNIAELIHNLGIGQSTGSGFGCVYQVNNKKYYDWKTV